MTAHDDPPARPGHEHSADDPFCVDAIRSLYLYLDRELGPEEVAAVEAHLHACSPCFEAYDFEAEFRMVISTKGRAPLPPDVHERLDQMLADLGADAVGPDSTGLGGPTLGGPGFGGPGVGGPGVGGPRLGEGGPDATGRGSPLG